MLAFSSLVVVWGCSGAGDTSSPEGAKKDETGSTSAAGATFAQVSEIITPSCTGCHGDTNPKDGVSLTTYDGIMKIVKAGSPADSQLVEVLRGTKGKVMPPNNPLPEDKIKTIESWISAGAKS